MGSYFQISNIFQIRWSHLWIWFTSFGVRWTLPLQSKFSTGSTAAHLQITSALPFDLQVIYYTKYIINSEVLASLSCLLTEYWLSPNGIWQAVEAGRKNVFAGGYITRTWWSKEWSYSKRENTCLWELDKHPKSILESETIFSFITFWPTIPFIIITGELYPSSILFSTQQPANRRLCWQRRVDACILLQTFWIPAKYVAFTWLWVSGFSLHIRDWKSRL